MVSSVDTILNICLYAIAVGTITILISFFTGPYNKGSVVGSMVGYSVITISLLFLVVIQANQNNSGLLSILLSSGPFIVVIATTLYLLYLLGNYFNEIVEGRVSKSYTTFINLYLLMILVQLFVYLKNPKDTKTSKMLLYLLGVFNSIVVITLGVILAYFSTDG
jgi:hypothetical protein